VRQISSELDANSPRMQSSFALRITLRTNGLSRCELLTGSANSHLTCQRVATHSALECRARDAASRRIDARSIHEGCVFARHRRRRSQIRMEEVVRLVGSAADSRTQFALGYWRLERRRRLSSAGEFAQDPGRPAPRIRRLVGQSLVALDSSRWRIAGPLHRRVAETMRCRFAEAFSGLTEGHRIANSAPRATDFTLAPRCQHSAQSVIHKAIPLTSANPAATGLLIDTPRAGTRHVVLVSYVGPPDELN
jgi:hypothetical protein